MGNLITRIKNGLLNRNTVTILCVIAGVILLWMIYSYVLDKAVDPQKVPIANKDLQAGTIITKEDFDYIEINSEALKKAKVITLSKNLIGQYVKNGTSIAKGAMFYQSQVVDKSKLIERDLEMAPAGYRLYWLRVDNTSTYANSIYPGDKIDLWLKAKIEGKYVYEEFITSIEVLAVRDSNGKNVFDVATNRTPAVLVFAIPTEMYIYLSKTEYLSETQLFPVPRNKAYTTEGGQAEFANEQLKTYIDGLSYTPESSYDDPSYVTNNEAQNNNE